MGDEFGRLCRGHVFNHESRAACAKASSQSVPQSRYREDKKANGILFTFRQ